MTNGDADGILEVVQKNELAEPTFIIEAEGKWYVVVTALEYDPARAENDVQRDGVRRIGDYCQQNLIGSGKVARLERSFMEIAQASGFITPVRPKPGGPRPGGGG